MIARLPGTSNAPAAPCTRARDGEHRRRRARAAHATLATVNDTEPDDEHPLAAEAVAERAAEQQQRGERDQIRVDASTANRATSVSRSSPIAGSATLTIVPSRNAMPEPSTVAAMTHRAAGVPHRMSPASVTRTVCPVTSPPDANRRDHARCMDDAAIIQRINELVAEEEKLQETPHHDPARCATSRSCSISASTFSASGAASVSSASIPTPPRPRSEDRRELRAVALRRPARLRPRVRP